MMVHYETILAACIATRYIIARAARSCNMHGEWGAHQLGGGPRPPGRTGLGSMRPPTASQQCRAHSTPGACSLLALGSGHAIGVRALCAPWAGVRGGASGLDVAGAHGRGATGPWAAASSSTQLTCRGTLTHFHPCRGISCMGWRDFYPPCTLRGRSWSPARVVEGPDAGTGSRTPMSPCTHAPHAKVLQFTSNSPYPLSRMPFGP